MIAPLWLVLTMPLGVAPAQFVWPRPELVEEIDIPDVIQADGVPVRLHVIRSKLSPEQLLQIYATAFDRAGFFVALQQKRVTAEPHLTALDVRTKISYSAILSPNPDGTTSCLLGEAALGKRRAPTAAADFAPLMPGAAAVARIDQEADRVISYGVQASVGEVNRFYRQALGAAGFVPAAEEENLYGKGAERIRVITKAKGAGKTSVVLMHVRAER